MRSKDKYRSYAELTRGLRNAVVQDRTQLAAFAQAVRAAIAGAADE
jgi:hypothetical protein